ncbi:hypothetical protein MY11210_007729 [Beauveria gryllotalpidicola]
MLLNFRLVATSLAALAACAQALNMTNFTNNEVGCGTPSLSLEQWTHLEEVLARGKNTPKRQEAQKHRIPVHVTVLAKNSTVNGGNIDDSQIQQVLDQVKKFYSYGFYLDTSVDTIHRHTRPDLFDRNSGMFTGNFHDIQRQYHRGEGDYTSLNIIFVFRLEDWYKVETTTQRLPNGNTWTSTRSSSGGVMGWSSTPLAEIWKYSNAIDLEKTDGILLSSAIIPDIAYPGYRGSLPTFAHEFGHWVGLQHTDHSNRKDTWGKKVCDPINDGIEDTPTHILDEKLRRTMQSCPSRDQVKTCQHLDSRSDPIYNLMVSMKFGCEVDGLTDGQIQRTLEVYRKFRMPYKQQMQQHGRWVQSEDQQPQDQQPQDQQPQDQQPQDQQPQDEQGDWRQQQIARLQSESNKAWDNFRREQAKYRQQMQQTGQRNLNDCFNQVDQKYKQRGESLIESMREKYNQLQAARNGLWKWLERYWQQPQYRQWAEEEWNRWENDFAGRQKDYEQEERGYWQDLERNSQQSQQSCRQWAQGEEARSLRELNKWEKESVKILQDNDSRAQQYINSL